jgi:hypothetical protein
MARTPSVKSTKQKATTKEKAASAKKKSSTPTTKGRKKKRKVADVVELTGSEDEGKGAIELECVCISLI